MNRRTPKNRLKPAPPPKAVARAARAQRLGLRAWREQHLYSLFSSLGRIAARPLATLLTLLVMALALAMPLLLFVLLDNAQQLRGDMQQAGAISVFLKPNQDAAVAETLARRLRARAGVASVTVKTPEQGLQEFRSQSGFADAMKVLHENPLPAVLVVTPRADAAGADAPAQLAGSLGAEPEVDLVQYDAAWRQRLDAILGAATRFAEVLAGLLALAALLVVGNTVRLDILGRSEEITVMQLLGASSAFVRRPFLYTGLWYGAFSAVLALAVIAAVELLLFKPLADLVASYDHRFAIHGMGWQPALATLALGAALGWLGAWLAASRHLLRGTPR
jgi:cell division transport system permease protein